MKGYPIPQGYKGYIPGMGYILFATQNEYEEYYNEHVNEKQKGKGKNIMNNATLTQTQGNETMSYRDEIRMRNKKARAYSAKVRKKRKAKETIATWLLGLSELAVFVWMIFEAFDFWSLIF